MIEINLVLGAEGRRSTSRGTAAFQLPSLPSLGGDSRVLLGGGAGLLLLLVAAYSLWSLGERRSVVEAEIRQEVRDSTGFATTIALVETLEARQDTIRRKIGIIREVDQRRYVWPHLMDEVSASVPIHTWLTQVSARESADTTGSAPSFSVQGHAGSTQALTRFMKNLEFSPFIRDVTLVTSEQVTQEGRAVHRFSLEARYETPDSSAIETVPIIVIR